MNTPTLCICGCGETPRVGRFRPGHDSRHAGTIRSALKRRDHKQAEHLARQAGWSIQGGQIVKAKPRSAGQPPPRPVVGVPGPSGTIQVACPCDDQIHLFAPGAAGRVVTASCRTRLRIRT